jgi:cytochrome c oxidase subunit 1
VLDYQAQDSYVVVAHFHYTLFAGSLFGLFAGLYLYWPKITGRYLSERLGRVHFALLVVGTQLTFLPMFVLGEQGMARRLADYPNHGDWTALNVLSTVGSGFIALGMVVFFLSVALSFLRAPSAPADAWETGMSLEWATSSPPPPQNFDTLPPIRSYAPLYDLRHGPPDAGSRSAKPQPQGASA